MESYSTDFTVNKADERTTGTRVSDLQFPRLMCKCHCDKVLIGLRGQDLTRWTQETHKMAYRCSYSLLASSQHTEIHSRANTKAHMLVFNQ